MLLSSQNIAAALLLADRNDLQELTKTFLAEKYQSMSDDLKARLLSHHATEGSQVPAGPPPFSAAFLAPTSKIVVFMMTRVLGNKEHALLDEVLLGFLASVFPPVDDPFIKFNYVQFLSNDYFIGRHEHVSGCSYGEG